VTIRQNVPYQEMDELYAAAKVVVHTSRVEGFSNVFIEAWKNGTPVVSLDVDTDGLIARHGLGRCVRSAAELKQAVVSLLASGPAWELCSRNARDYALTHHDLDRQLERWRALFRSLAPEERTG
jgi:glycosyltransferase involved in cell wall biosynthesis